MTKNTNLNLVGGKYKGNFGNTYGGSSGQQPQPGDINSYLLPCILDIRSYHELILDMRSGAYRLVHFEILKHSVIKDASCAIVG